MILERAHTPILALNRDQIESRIRGCARLPSLSSINSALRELLTADQRYTSQISEIIRRDPSLTSRLLRLVNSVYYGFSNPVNSIEEAVFYLGVRQIRQLAMVTPVIEDFQKLAGNSPFPWRGFWQHCIGTAIMTREVLSSIEVPQDDADYVGGLIHDVGKIVMASTFSTHFEEIQKRAADGVHELQEIEREVLGIDHSDLGAMYLRNHNLPEALIQVARHHHHPEKAEQNGQIIAAVQISDLLIRHAKIGNSGNHQEVQPEDWLNASGWQILFPGKLPEDVGLAHADVKRSLERLPLLLEGLV